MNTALDKVSHSVQRKAISAMLDTTLKQLHKDREKTYQQLVDLAGQFWGKDVSKRCALRSLIRIINGFVLLTGLSMRPIPMLLKWPL
jgi:hypothetical protein